MNKRKLIISLIGVVILAGGIALSGILAGAGGQRKARPSSADVGIPVRTRTVSNGPVEAIISITGRVIAAEKIDLYAEVSGIATYGARPFKSGTQYNRGEILLKIDDSEFKRALASAKSQFMSTIAQVLPDLKLDYPDYYQAWRSYLVNFNVDGPLEALPEATDEQLRLFLTGRNIYATYYSILESETRLGKYLIRAPFTGSLTESSVNQGALVRTGQQLGEFIKSGRFELEASIAQGHLKYLKKGGNITFSEVNSSKTYNAKLVRINDKIDPGSQLVKVYFQLNDPSLKSGLYLEGKIGAATINNAVELPLQAIVDDTHVFIVQNDKAVKFPVAIADQTTDRAVIAGLENGVKVIIDKKNSAFEGSTVIEANRQ